MRELAANARQQRTTAVRKAADEDADAIEESKERDAIRRDRIDDVRKERNIT